MRTPEEFDVLRRRITSGEFDRPPLPDPLPVLPDRVEGANVIDLRELEPEQWVEALRLMPRRARWHATKLLGEDGALRAAHVLRLPPPRAPRPRALDEPANVPVPSAPGVRRRASRSVCFRLPPEQHEDLDAIAADLGMSAAALAKASTISGLNRAIEERR